MVFLFNKAKIYSYVVAVTTVVVLFAVAANINTEEMAIQTSATQNNNIVENNNINVIE